MNKVIKESIIATAAISTAIIVLNIWSSMLFTPLFTWGAIALLSGMFFVTVLSIKCVEHLTKKQDE